jgi:hypothetical protein
MPITKTSGYTTPMGKAPIKLHLHFTNEPASVPATAKTSTQPHNPRSPMNIGDQIEAQLLDSGVTITITRTHEHYHVVALDWWGRPTEDGRWTRSFTGGTHDIERAARDHARMITRYLYTGGTMRWIVKRIGQQVTVSDHEPTT